MATKTNAVSQPQWLANHGGKLAPSANGLSWLVDFGIEPAYALVAIPAEGKHTVKILETVSGKQFSTGKVYPNIQAALEAGAEALREKLGW